MDICNLLDLGYTGHKYTWFNKRRNSPIFERLDRFWATPSWIQLYQEAVVQNLPRLSCAHLPTIPELKEAVFSIGALKSPGEDGFHALFFQKFWETIHLDCFNLISSIFHSKTIPTALNKTIICLIPKVQNPTKITSYRPISLVNCCYKFVSNILARMPFTKFCLHYFNFSLDTIDLIMSCVTSVSSSILINGHLSRSFTPSRGLRQGDPLSPYLFIICMEYFSRMIHKECDRKSWSPFRFRVGKTNISHLLFADDVLLFGQTDKKTLKALASTLSSFYTLSGQKMNDQKSSILFSPTPQSMIDEFEQELNITATSDLGKYLGFPLSSKKPSKRNLQGLVDKLGAKLATWKSKSLTKAGRQILIQSSLQAIPRYFMQSIWIPKYLNSNLDSICSNFLWGSSTHQKKITWVSWDKVCKPKEDGGLGFTKHHQLNSISLAKMCWSVYNNKGWAANLLKEIYIDKKTQSNSIFQGILHLESSLALPLSAIHSCSKNQMEEKITFPLSDQLFDLIQSVFFSANKDSHFSSWTLKSKFDSKKAKLAIQSLDNLHAPPFNWELIWKSNTFPKIKTFLWLLAWERIPHRENLSKKIQNFSPKCQFCPGEDETCSHVFIHCTRASEFWNSVTCPSLFSGDDSWLEWLSYNLKLDTITSYSIPWNVMFCFVLWHLWLRRNAWLFSKTNIPLSTAISQCIWAASEFYFSTKDLRMDLHLDMLFEIEKRESNAVALKTICPL
ncbi:uncharacterized protein LOC110706423 [Chenopodium quinoa]|uniref:uncharacterized protein LOC110706423 n=1 Tax=Chenopodium quinoa TaxID=63459 RepID=UPI000B79AE90|nr:uncharacterized protein LOC110706423 [Chenopodium quinoa]